MSVDDLIARATPLLVPRARVVDLPTVEQFKSIWDICLYASTGREEDRHVRFRVGVVRPRGVDRPEEPVVGWQPFTFDRPVQLSERSLTKIALATDPRQTLIGIQEGSSGKFEIWGFLHTGMSRHRAQTRSRIGANWVGPDFLTIEAQGPAVLTLHVGHATIKFTRGHVSETSFNPLFAVGSKGLLKDYFAAGERIGLSQWSWERSITLLLRRIREWSHGGAVLIATGSPVGIDFKHRLSPPSNILLSSAIYLTKAEELERRATNAFLFDGLVDQNVTDEERADLARGLARSGPDATRLTWEDDITAVAKLAQVDGALVLSKELLILGFGAIVDSVNDLSPLRALNHLGTETEAFNLADVGTRHRAAVAFCAQNPASCAFTVSQDGAVSFAKTIDGKVVLWTPITLESPIPIG